MAEKKVTEMILKADLQCDCCYKKVRKLLSRYPEIRDWIFDDNSGTVTITVTCCDPERLRYKLCRNGADVIKSIEIKKPEEATTAEPPKLEQVTPPPANPEPAPKAPEPVEMPPEPAPKAPEQAQKGPEPSPGDVEPVRPAQCVGSCSMPMVCMQCLGGRMVGPWNSGSGRPSVYLEGCFYGRIGLDFGPNGPRHCSHHGHGSCNANH